MKIRKPVYDLTQRDLLQTAVWEFALDEEGEDGQDEATVRPWAGKEPLDPGDGMFVVRAIFTLADGTRLLGYLTPAVPGMSSMGTIQPVIVTDEGQVMFWYGLLAPTTESLQDTYLRLGRVAEQVFPVTYASDVELTSGPVSGQIAGFMHLRSFTDQSVVESQ